MSTPAKHAATLAGRLDEIGQELSLPLNLKLSVEHIEHGWILRVGDPKAKDNVTGEPFEWWGRKWLLSEHMTDGEIVQTAWLAAQVAIEHEMRETFLFRGQAIFDPHYDINKLVALRSQPDALKERAALATPVLEREGR